jgi:hypothetical protein
LDRGHPRQHAVAQAESVRGEVAAGAGRLHDDDEFVEAVAVEVDESELGERPVARPHDAGLVEKRIAAVRPPVVDADGVTADAARLRRTLVHDDIRSLM